MWGDCHTHIRANEHVGSEIKQRQNQVVYITVCKQQCVFIGRLKFKVTQHIDCFVILSLFVPVNTQLYLHLTVRKTAHTWDILYPQVWLGRVFIFIMHYCNDIGCYLMLWTIIHGFAFLKHHKVITRMSADKFQCVFFPDLNKS